VCTHDYKSVVIKSAHAPSDHYNFYDHLTSGGWFGFRSLYQSTFADFCGLNNEMQIGSPTTDRQILPEMNDMCERLGFGSVEECMHPKTLLEFFNYEIPTDMSKFPPCYTHVPFAFRNAPTDTPINAPNLSRDSSICASPQHNSQGSKSQSSPLSPLDENTARRTTRPLKRQRASPTNLARYPREPERVTNINEAMQWTKFARARGLAGAPRRIADDDDDDAPPTTSANKFIFEVADDEDNEEVRLALT